MFKKSLLTIATLALVSTGASAAEKMEVRYKDKVWKTVVAVDSMSDSSYCKVTSARRKHITANPSMVYINTKNNGIVRVVPLNVLTMYLARSLTKKFFVGFLEELIILLYGYLIC